MPTNADHKFQQSATAVCTMHITMGPYTFDPEKATEAILYVSSRVGGDMYATLKLLYLSDKLHLHKYGRFLCGDDHYALPYGPVPQGAYDLIKYVRGAGGASSALAYEPARTAFAMDGNTIRPLRAADPSLFSDSDEECLNEVIEAYGGKHFEGLKEATHDAAYHATTHCHLITPAAIASMSDDSAALIQHLADRSPDTK